MERFNIILIYISCMIVKSYARTVKRTNATATNHILTILLTMAICVRKLSAHTHTRVTPSVMRLNLSRLFHLITTFIQITPICIMIFAACVFREQKDQSGFISLGVELIF